MSDSKQTKIIYTIADANFSGGPKHLLNLIEGLDARKFDFVVISPEGVLTEKLYKLNVKHIPFNFTRGWNTVGKLKNIIRAELDENTILHAQGVKAGFFTKKVNKSLSQKLIYTEHNWTKDYRLRQNWRRGYQLRMLRRLSQYVTFNVCVSEAVQKFLISEKIVNEDNSGVIYNGVKFKKLKLREKTSPMVLGTIASLDKRKGLLFLLEAIARFKQIHPKQKIFLKLVGKGPEEKFLKQHAVDLGINFDIQWLTPRANLTSFWKSINIYVQPSLDESFGMALVEAMGFRLPVISTTAGALPEIVGDTGLLVEPANSDQLAKAIENVINNDTIREENIKKAYKRAKKLFSIEKMIEQYEKLYGEYS